LRDLKSVSAGGICRLPTRTHDQQGLWESKPCTNQLLTILRHLSRMGRPALDIKRFHLNLHPEDMAKIEAIVGSKGMSKFVRDAIKEKLSELAPGEEIAGPPYFENDGGHFWRLSLSGRATVLSILRKRKASLDDLQKSFGVDDPVDFLHVLLGHKHLPNGATTVVITQLLGKLYRGE
jgi:hypothetical protein